LNKNETKENQRVNLRERCETERKQGLSPHGHYPSDQGPAGLVIRIGDIPPGSRRSQRNLSTHVLYSYENEFWLKKISLLFLLASTIIILVQNLREKRKLLWKLRESSFQETNMETFGNQILKLSMFFITYRISSRKLAP